MAEVSRKDAMFCAVAIAILVIGAATGGAIAMFAMAIVGLFITTFVYRKQLGGSSLLIAASAMAVAVVIGWAITR